MSTDARNSTSRPSDSQPRLHQQGLVTQEYRHLPLLPSALGHDVRLQSVALLNQILADSQILYGLYKKHHRLMRDPTFYSLHLLLDEHARAQLELIDALAERVQVLGGVAVGDPWHVVELTALPRPPAGVEEVPVMLSRLLDCHETVITKVRRTVDRTSAVHDDRTADLLTGQVLREHEAQVWFLAEHLVQTSLAVVDG
jgi:starvation-inducible DNA-binding protein